MTTYKTRPGVTALEAARIDSLDGDVTRVLPKWALDAARHQLADIGTRGDVQFTTPGGARELVKQSDWLVQLPDGQVTRMEAEVFEQLFDVPLEKTKAAFAMAAPTEGDVQAEPQK